MYTDTGFTLSRRHVSNQTLTKKTLAKRTLELPPRRALPALILRPRHDGLSRVEAAFFAVILGGFALTAGTFAVQLLT